MNPRTAPALLALTTLLLTGCTDDGADVRTASSSTSGSSTTSGSASGTGSGSGSADCASPAPAPAVTVKMTEYTIEAAPARVAPGRIAFAVTNDGKDVHELVVVKGNSPSAYPRVVSTDPATNSAVDEDRLPAGSFIGEVEGIPAGTTCGGSFALTSGDYVLLCNIVEVRDGESRNHLDLGMQTKLTVS